jgi:hypothetical protein
MPGRAIEMREDSGWAWPELDFVDDGAGGAPRAHRDALKLLATFIQHTDSKPAQQRLVCLAPDASKEIDACPETFMMLDDVGQTFGRANIFNRDAPGSVNFELWASTPVWKDDKRCIGNLPKSSTGTLDDPVISEGGRRFLADLLIQLSDVQLRDLFETSRFPMRSRYRPNGRREVTADDWVEAFKHKRTDVVQRSCPQ